MARILTTYQKNSLSQGSVISTLKIELETYPETLYLATGACTIGGQDYQPLIEFKSGLRMSLAKKADKIDFEIVNLSYLFGQGLIADESIFDNSFAVLGAYHKHGNQTWHDEKICGEIVVSQINGDAISCKLISEIESAFYDGKMLSTEFTGIPPVSSPGDFNDILNRPSDVLNIGRGKYPIEDDPNFGRVYMPEVEPFLIDDYLR